MKFLLEFVTCCGACSSEARLPGDETRLLVVGEPRRRMLRRRGRVGGRSRDWQPSLSSITEENVPATAGRVKNMERPAAGWRSSLKRKIPSVPPRRDRVSSKIDHHDFRRDTFSNLTPQFSPAPFMF